MFTNVWYVAERSENLTDEPIKVTMLGRDFVLYRDQNGKAVCLSNVCPHRGASLAAGQCHVDGTISCPYHGWNFEPGGACTRIPSLENPEDVVPGAKIDSYPVQEKYGLIWTLLGDDPDAAMALFEMEEFDNPEWRMMVHEDVWHTNVHWAKFTNLDHVHLCVVHGMPFLYGDNPARPPDHYVREIENGIWTQIHTLSRQSRGDWSKLRDKDQGTVSTMRFWVPGFTLSARIEIGGAGSGIYNVFYETSTPIDETHTQMRWTLFRNFMMEPENDEEYLKRNFKNIYEDKAIGEDMRPKGAPVRPAKNALFVDREDRMVQAYWNLMETMTAKGWQIDAKRLRDLEGDNYYRVIPSPARKAGGTDWVHEPVPLIPGKRVAAAAAE